MRPATKAMLFFALSALAAIALMFCVVSVRSMYDVTPNTWGPPGVAFAEWHDAWRARRNLYLWLTVVSFFASVVFALGGLRPLSRRTAPQIVGSGAGTLNHCIIASSQLINERHS